MNEQTPLQGIVLASRSPRRQELLTQIGVSFTTVDPNVDECRQAGEQPAAFVERLALAKAAAGQALAGNGRPVLGADTAVVIDGEILGKPVDGEEAGAMLQRLSGRTHRVLTGIALAEPGGVRSLVVTSRVTFRRLRVEEIAAYRDSGETAGKAGAYAIQGRAAIFVSHLEGSYSNVVGLPLFETAGLLVDAGIHPLGVNSALEPGAGAAQ